MTLNLNAETGGGGIPSPCDPSRWTALQAEMCMNVALAKLDAFAAECERMAEYVRVGILPRNIAADYLNEAALYNSLYFEYGPDRIQDIMATLFQCGRAAA